MEVNAPFSSSLQPYPFPFLLFFLIFSFTVFILSLLVMKFRDWCDCELCHTYTASKWTTNFVNLCDWYTHLLRKSPSMTVHIHALNNTITANPQNVEYILKSNFENYPKGNSFSTILGDLLGQGIFNVDGDLWRFQRKMASYELGSLSTRAFAFQIISSEIENRLLPLMKAASEKNYSDSILDLQEVFRRFTYDCICKFSFGLDPHCLELSLSSSEFADAFDSASNLSAYRALCVSPFVWKVKRFLNLGSERKLKEAIKIVDMFAYEVIREKRKLGFSTHHDLLSRFMSSIQDEKYLRDIVVSFILAGRDTVAAGLTSLFWLLSKDPQVTKSILLELNQVVCQKDQPVSFDELKEMHYLHAVLHESMRLYPPIQFDSKFALNDDVLPDGTVIRKGTRVTYHAYAMGRMEALWGSGCSEFQPERWIKNGVFNSESTYKYPVFHSGFRMCLGKEMALMEMKSVAVALLRQFDLQEIDEKMIPEFSPWFNSHHEGRSSCAST